MMNALVYTRDHEVAYQQAPEPAPEAGEVLVRIDAVGICGSDMHAWHGHDPRRVPPLILGHEASGQVITGRDVLRRVFAGESLTGRTELAGVVFDNHFSPLRGPQGRVRGFLGIATDVTTRVHALRDREALEHQLRQAQKM